MLFFTVVQGGGQPPYSLYSVAASDTKDRPQLVRSDLPDDKVYAFRGKLLPRDIIGPGKPISTCDYYCYVDDRAGRMFVLYPDVNQDLSLDVVDLATMERVARSTGDIVDFTVADDKVTVYMTGKIETLDLSQRR